MDTKPFKDKLEEEKKRLEGQMRGVGRENPEIPGDWEPSPMEEGNEPDIIDRAEAVTNLEENAGVLADLEARYADVREALKRIEEGTYGSCEVCGEDISSERLAADSAATTCTAHF